MPDLISLKEAVAKYGIHRATLWRAVSDGRLTAYDGGLGDRNVYVDRAELEAALKPTPRQPRKSGEPK